MLLKSYTSMTEDDLGNVRKQLDLEAQKQSAHVYLYCLRNQPI